jgi:protein-disulfide isomerase
LLLSLFFISCASPQHAGEPDTAASQASSPVRDSDVVPVGDSPVRGSQSAPVTVVMFAGFQCADCRQAAQTLQELQEKRPEDVRVVFKHVPSAFSKQEQPMALAAVAADEQGKFWQMHDWLYDHQMDLRGEADEAIVEQAAEQARALGLDADRFKAAVAERATKLTVDEDRALADRLGVNQRPYFLVNGQQVPGSKTLSEFNSIVAQALERTEMLRDEGVAAADLYRAAVATRGGVGQIGITRRAKLPITPSDPVLGKADAVLSVVMFTDFQCPFCQRGTETVRALQEKYPQDVNVVFKHYPLPFHKQAPDAARAAIAAGKQGKFWQMHDWLFENQSQFKNHADDMKQWTAAHAKQLDLDVARFIEDYEDPASGQKIKADMDLGEKVDVQGTPHFFVNGERVKGAKPLDAFEVVVRDKLEQARELKSDGVDDASLYAKMVDENLEVDEDKTPENKPKRPAPKVEFVPVDADDPMMGNTDDPLVTIVEFADFQCPYCAMAVPTVKRINREYGDQVRIVFKQLPAEDRHAQAKPAAIAALAAHRQGKFWQMHDKLFDNQREMRKNVGDFKGFASAIAKDLGLDVVKFKQDFDDPALAKKAEDDLALSKEIGVRGTPNFWINGVNLRGAQPYPAFEAEIDAQIEKAKLLEAQKNLSGEALYKALVAQNKANSPAREPQPAEPQPAEPQPKERQPAPKVDVSKLEAGDAPTKGPDDAPVKIVAFADFQCPYSNRASKNLEKVAAKFGDKVQLVFKHYPLPFHKEARAAAMAAMAAGEQGKFWQMHDLIFDNQRRLKEDAIFEELAEELGLNMSKFKKDFQNPAYQAAIDEDKKQGLAVGVRGTPIIFINGTRMVGAQPTSKLEARIKEALK